MGEGLEWGNFVIDCFYRTSLSLLQGNGKLWAKSFLHFEVGQNVFMIEVYGTNLVVASPKVTKISHTLRTQCIWMKLNHSKIH